MVEHRISQDLPCDPWTSTIPQFGGESGGKPAAGTFTHEKDGRWIDVEGARIGEQPFNSRLCVFQLRGKGMFRGEPVIEGKKNDSMVQRDLRSGNPRHIGRTHNHAAPMEVEDSTSSRSAARRIEQKSTYCTAILPLHLDLARAAGACRIAADRPVHAPVSRRGLQASSDWRGVRQSAHAPQGPRGYANRLRPAPPSRRLLPRRGHLELKADLQHDLTPATDYPALLPDRSGHAGATGSIRRIQKVIFVAQVAAYQRCTPALIFGDRRRHLR